jgi:hypothetical protein
MAVVGGAVAALLAVGGYWYVMAGGGDDDRPPIVVNNGSLIFNGGDPGDSPTIKAHWHDWKKDLLSSHWKPDFPKGFSVDHYDVSVTTAGQPCASTSGDASVTIEYTRTDGGTPSPATFTINIHPLHGFGKREPKVDPGANPMTATPVTTDSSGNNTAPAKLTFSPNGYISSMTVSSSAGSASCQFGPNDNPVITVQPRKQ